MEYINKETFDLILKKIEKWMIVFKNENLSEFIKGFSLDLKIEPNKESILDKLSFYLPIYYPKVIISEKDTNTFYLRVKVEEIWDLHTGVEKEFDKLYHFDLMRHSYMVRIFKFYNIKNDLTDTKTKYYSMVIKKKEIPENEEYKTYCEKRVTEFLLKKLFPEKFS
jgi:hypothetical protein